MTITDAERFKIIQKLRNGIKDTEYMNDHDFLTWLYKNIGHSEDGYLLTRLADLIELEQKSTCNIVFDGELGDFVCTKCGSHFDSPTYNGSIPEKFRFRFGNSYKATFNFCPCCGAEVIE